MKFFVRLVACVCIVAASAAAQATSYKFSYSFASAPWFNNGPVSITGSFDGVANGNLIDQLSNIYVYENGVAFIGNGKLFSSYESAAGITLFAGVASLDGTQNNFNFTDGQHNNFQMAITTPIAGGSKVYTAAVLDWPVGLYNNDSDANIAARWSISAVPEPATYTMLLAGMGLLAFAARRRQNSAACLFSQRAA